MNFRTKNMKDKITKRDVEKFYEERKHNPLYNTSYPLDPMDWSKFKSKEYLPFEKEETLSFYIHIPFCHHLCSFCEYMRLHTPSEELQFRYLDNIQIEIENFLEKYPNIKLVGFDIGGGTPTALSEKAFKKLLHIFGYITRNVTPTFDFEPSIEGTFPSISKEKFSMLTENGIHRISFGVQSSNKQVTDSNKRGFSSLERMEEIINKALQSGMKKINLDFMYGLKNQNIETLSQDLQTIKTLNPEQVTLYELRTNRILENNHTTNEQRYEMYSLLFEGLLSMGYHSKFGQNTFSKSNTDMGVSSYLRHRMKECCSYKGFGMGAQSMSKHGLAYNLGKGGKNLMATLERDSYPEEYTYLLPPLERVSKYIAIAAYSGAFSLKVVSSILNCDAKNFFSNQLQFCIEKSLITLENDIVRITKDDFKYYGAVFSLFYDLKKV